MNMNAPRTPEPPRPPADLDQHTTITIDNEQFEIEADDLEVICELGNDAFTEAQEREIINVMKGGARMELWRR